MTETILIPEKRKLFLELILKLMSYKERTFEFGHDILEKLNQMITLIEKFKNSIHIIINQIRENIIEFLNSTNLLENVNDYKFKNYILKKFSEISIKNEQIKNINLIKIRDKSEQFEKYHLKDNKKLVKNIFNDINLYLNKIDRELIKIEKKQEDIKKKDLEIVNNLIDKFQFLKNFIFKEDRELINTFFDYINENFIKFFKNKKLNFSYIQIRRAYKENFINYEKLIYLIKNTLYTELIGGLINYLLEKNIELTFEIVKSISNFPNETIQNAFILLMDRRIILAIEKSGQIKYKLIEKKSKKDLIFDELIKKLTKLRNLGNIEIINKLIDKLNKLNNILIKNPELIDEKYIKDILDGLYQKIISIENNITAISTKKIQKPLNLRLLAAIELYQMKRIPLIFEKGQFMESEDKFKEFGEFDLNKYINENIPIEFKKALIVVVLKNYGAMTPVEISEITGIKQSEVVDLLITMIKDNQIEVIEEKDSYFLYDIPHKLNKSEKILKDFLDFITLLIFNLKKLLQIKELKNENFTYLHNLLILIQESMNKLAQFEFNSRKIISETLFPLFSEFNEIIKISQFINNRIKEKQVIINIEQLVPILVPEREDEIDTEYDKYIVGFGEILWNSKKCIHCKSCVEICPESALNFKTKWDINEIFNLNNEEIENLPENKKITYKLIKNLALKTPSNPIILPKNYLGLGNIETIPIKCIACRKCEDRCPNSAIEFKKVWDFPDVIRDFINKYIIQ
ncbi:MAG: 4Fe-4S binding protein [Candidatus Helarchaeota archaeon]